MRNPFEKTTVKIKNLKNINTNALLITKKLMDLLNNFTTTLLKSKINTTIPFVKI